MRITYGEFKSVLLREGYQKKEIADLFCKFKKMNSESRSWVLQWLEDCTLPQVEVEGVTAQMLISKLRYRPLNAFIMLNWLQENPEEANFYLQRFNSSIVFEEKEEEIDKLDDEVLENEELTD